MYKLALFKVSNPQPLPCTAGVIPIRYEGKHLGDECRSCNIYIHCMKLGTFKFWLVSDVQCGSRRAPRSDHEVTGQDTNLDFQEAKLGCEARLGSSQMLPDRCPSARLRNSLCVYLVHKVCRENNNSMYKYITRI